jgi:AcrR family transcriptional regulator
MQGPARRGRLAEIDRRARGDRERAVLDAAAVVLQKRGPEGFNVRAVARAAGASTIVVYTLFGSRDALLSALQKDGLERLADALAGVSAADPLARLGAMALAYLAFARANPQYYLALSVAPGAGGEFARAARSSRAFGLLAHCVRACMKDGLLTKRDPDVVADGLWALVHGIVSLDLGGYFRSADEGHARLVGAGVALLRGFGAKHL